MTRQKCKTCTIEAPPGFLSVSGRCASCEYERFTEAMRAAKVRDQIIETINEQTKIARIV